MSLLKTSVCCCCLSEGILRDLRSTYVCFNNKEVYSEMIRDCFNIILSNLVCNENGICEKCINILRDSFAFKQQVIKSEAVLLNKLKEERDEKPTEVKTELKLDSGDESDHELLSDHSDHFAAHTVDTVKHENESPVKKKAEQRSGNRKRVLRSKNNETESVSIKRLVTRLGSVVKKCEKPENTKTPAKRKMKTHKITISKSSMNNRNITIVMKRTAREKDKHKTNLQTLLKFSNATPFKTKSLLGFTCGYCEAAFPDPTDLRTHTDVKHKEMRLDFQSSFDLEYCVKLDVTDLKCTACEMNMDNLGQLKEHIVKKHNTTIFNDIKDLVLPFKLKKDEVYHCVLCSNVYETFKMLKVHMNKHYGNYSCNHCESSFTTKRSLQAHIGTHETGSFQCDHCEKIFSSNAKRLYHEKCKHFGMRNISNCPYCNESFQSYYRRNQHLLRVHNSGVQYKCNVCNKAYVLKSLLSAHIKTTHLMERNHQCSECGSSFYNKKALTAHMVKHNGERIYACEVCPKKYARKYTLREHMRIHNNDRRFKCEVCALAFVQKCSLKSHLLSNHGITSITSDVGKSV